MAGPPSHDFPEGSQAVSNQGGRPPSTQEVLPPEGAILREFALLINVPTAQSELRFAIRASDWHRLKRRVAHLEDRAPNVAAWYSIAFSIASSFAVSLFAILAGGGKTADWFTPGFLSVIVASLIVGFCLVSFERRLGLNTKRDLKELKTDMGEVESPFKDTPHSSK